MPTISIQKSDLERLAGKTYDMPDLERALEYAKAEVKAEEGGEELRVQLKDTNRPDLWCCEGLARQIKGQREQVHPDYAFFSEGDAGGRSLEVDPGLESIRPYVAAFAVRGLDVDDAALKQMIDTQERLADNYGRGRSAIAIGIYDASDIVFPVRFDAVDPDTTRFVPLESDTEMSRRQILTEHPTGRTYAPLLEGFDRFPLLRDQRDEILSMPPIINSASLGRVEVGDDFLFVEATGTELDLVLHTMAMMAANFADRRGEILPVTVKYPYDTPRGREIRCPVDMAVSITSELAEVRRVLGGDLSPEQIQGALVAMGYRDITLDDRCVTATAAPYRDDLMHPVDMIEDIIIATGFDTFEPEMPKDFTIGKSASREDASDRIRDIMVGSGFQEVFLPILGSVEDQRERMCNPDASVLTISNPMSEQYGAVRSTLLPGLLSVESTSRRAIYPHRLFEVGEISVPDAEQNYGTRTDIRLAALEAREDANLSGIQSFLEALGYYLGFEYALDPVDHPSFLSGRAGEIVAGGTSWGVIGEVHPEVLENWGVTMPVSAFEIDIRITGS